MTIQTRRDVLRLAASFAALPLVATRALAATEHTVTIKKFSFSPAELTIKAGDTVTFINEDKAAHTATADKGGFDTGKLRGGAAGSVTITAKGSHSYFCAYHRSMKATINVS